MFYIIALKTWGIVPWINIWVSRLDGFVPEHHLCFAGQGFHGRKRLWTGTGSSTVGAGALVLWRSGDPGGSPQLLLSWWRSCKSCTDGNGFCNGSIKWSSSMFNSFKSSTYFSAQPGVPKIELSMQFHIPGTRLASAWIVQKHPNSSHKPHSTVRPQRAPRRPSRHVRDGHGECRPLWYATGRHHDAARIIRWVGASDQKRMTWMSTNQYLAIICMYVYIYMYIYICIYICIYIYLHIRNIYGSPQIKWMRLEYRIEHPDDFWQFQRWFLWCDWPQTQFFGKKHLKHLRMLHFHEFQLYLYQRR